MSAQRDGGSAFPRPGAWSPGGGRLSTEQEGMSLRDWFAGQALAGLSAEPLRFSSEHKVAGAAYQLADAMLAAREVRS